VSGEKKVRGLTGEMPDQAHLMIYTDLQANLVTALPPGAVMGVMVRPKDKDPMHKVVLTKVERKRWIFQCMCNPGCKVKFVANITEVGRHARHPYER